MQITVMKLRNNNAKYLQGGLKTRLSYELSSETIVNKRVKLIK